MSQEYYRQMWHQIKDEKSSFKGEVKNQRKSGEVYTALLMISPILDESKNLYGFVGIEEDITERAKSEIALKASEVKYRAMIENSSEVIALLDRKGNLLYESPSVTRVIGYTPAERIGKSGFDLLHPDDLLRVKSSFADLLANPHEQKIDSFRLKHKDGSWRWIDAVGKNAEGVVGVGAIVVNYHDVSEKKEALAKLEQQTRLLKTEKTKGEVVLAGIGEGVVVVNQEGIITLFNKMAEKLLNIGAKNAIGNNYKLIFRVRSSNGEEIINNHPIETVLSAGRPVFSADFRVVKEGGEDFAAFMSVSKVVLDGKIVGAVNVFRDISKEKEVDKMKTEFISLASHQLRTPLSATKWFLEIMLTDEIDGLNKKQIESLRSIDESNERMIDLVNSLLNVSRIEAGRVKIQPVPCDYRALVNEIVVGVKRQIEEKNQTLSIDISDDLHDVMIDGKLISQVFLNLLTNSSKYSPEGASITITARKEGSMILTKVSDNGYGIPAEEQERVFGKFFRGGNIVKMDTEGNGLGLYLAKMVVDQFGGKIWFESAGENKGTSFWFSLPITGMKPKEGI